MLKPLSRRWLGVACWVYLLSLMLAAFLFWMLPGSPVVHTWNFQGTIRFEGFTRDHRNLVVNNQRADRTVFHQLRIDTGECTTYLPLQHPDQELDYQSLMKPPSSLTIPCNTEHVRFFPGRLTAIGEAVIADNERWLIMTRQYAQPWQPLIPWLRKTFSWNPDFLADGWRYSAAIIDLTTNQEIACPLWTHDQPTYSIHPEGLGFAVLDEKVVGTSFATQTQLSTSKITWFTLPLGPAHHSVQQWYLILGAFVLPISLSLLLSLLGRLCKGKASAITAEAPLSKN